MVAAVLAFLKRTLAVAIVLSLTTNALAAGVDDLPLLKKYPLQRKLIEEYWNAFQRANNVGPESGSQIATQIFLFEIEDKLVPAGLSPDDVKTLREQATDLVKKAKREVEVLYQDDEIVRLAEQIDTTSDLDARMEHVLKKRQAYRSIYEAGRKSRFLMGNEDLAYRVSTGLLLLYIIETEGYKMNRSDWRRVVGPTYTLLKTAIDQNPLATDRMEDVLANKVKSPVTRQMITQWKKYNPIPFREMNELSMPKNVGWMLHGFAIFITTLCAAMYFKLGVGIFSLMTMPAMIYGPYIFNVFNSKKHLARFLGLDILKTCHVKMNLSNRRK